MTNNIEAYLDYLPLLPIPLDMFADGSAAMLHEAFIVGVHQGIPVLPLRNKDANEKQKAKSPLIDGGYKNASTDPDQIFSWWKHQFPGAMIGVPTGQRSGLLIIDTDIKNGKNGEAELEKWEEKNGLLPQTFTVRTISGGYHRYYKIPAGVLIPKKQNAFGAKGIDILGEGAYAVYANSMAADGRMYEIIDDSAVADLPEAYIDFFLSPPQKVERPVNNYSGEYHHNQSYRKLSDDEVRNALSYLDPDMEYSDWLNVGMALHASGYDCDLWGEWSRTGTKYTGDCEYKWSSFSAGSGITMGTFIKMAIDAGWSWDSLNESQEEERSIEFINPVSLQGQPIPERQWIVPSWIPLHCTTSLYGDGGTGKSLLAMQLMTAAALGKPFLGMAVAPVKTIGFFCEDTKDELQRRQGDINRAYDCDFSDLHNMRWYSGVGEDNILMNFGKDQKGKITRLFNIIEEKALETGAQLIVIDTAADTFGGNEINRAQVRQFINALTGLAIKVNGAVLLCAHPSVDGMKTGEGYGGSTAWNNSVRSRLYLTRQKEAERTGPHDPDARTLSRKKANYAQTNDDLTLYWLDGVFVPVGSNGLADSVIRQGEQKAEESFLLAMEDFKRQNRNISDSKKSTNYAPKILLKNPNCAGLSKSALEGAMERLFQKGIIINEPYGRGSNPSYKIIRREK